MGEDWICGQMKDGPYLSTVTARMKERLGTDIALFVDLNREGEHFAL